MRRPNVFTIPSGLPFLPTLIDAVRSGRLGAIEMEDPIALGRLTVLLPTRRAARAMRELLIEQSPARAALLPRIRPIGDVDEEEHLLSAVSDDPADALKLPPPITRLDRTLALSEMILAWRRSVVGIGTAPADTQALIPASAADAIRLAGDLARLIDDVAIADIDWSAIAALPPEEYAGYWQETLAFLKIAGELWPRYLADVGRADPAIRRNELLRAQAHRLAATPPDDPIIAAGSTGSIPATAELLKAIAQLPAGAVILPGLDTEMDAESWEAIGNDERPDAAPSHPQFGLKRLLADLGVERSDVQTIGEAPAPLAARARLVAEALRPAATTERWAAAGDLDGKAMAGVDLIEARNEQEEALAIAVALRESLETPSQIAALVTPDRTLAGRVAVQLQRWNVRIDDSAGRPLDTTQQGVFLRLLADAALNGDVTALLSLVKHPLARFGLSRGRCRRAAKVIEIAILRGPTGLGSIASLSNRLVNLRFGQEMRADRFVPRARRRLSKAEWALAEELAAKLGAIVGPLEALARQSEVTIGEATEALAAALGAATDAGFYDDRAGDACADLLSGLLDSNRLALPPGEYPAFLASAMGGVTVTPDPAFDPRIHIWGTLEARLQSVDLLILGGLDEGVWPAEARTDAWLSRSMRAAVGLPPPERRIGLAAHDFAQAMAAERVILSRAKRRGGTPTVASRWVQRLEALARNDIETLRARGDRFISLARRLDAVAAEDVKPALRPSPRPRVDARPRELSVTAIENLIRDPYAVYARRILQLEPLDPIAQRADPRLRGSLIHEAFADFTREWRGPFDRAARARFLLLWRQHFEAIEAYPEVHAIWSLRAEEIADWFIGWEGARDDKIASRHPEIPGELSFETALGPFKLTGRADRIDVMSDGRIGIYDYKTGVVASAKQVLLFQPQLALEGAMAREGAFGKEFKDRSIAELAWIGLGRVSRSDVLRSAVDTDAKPDADAVAAEAFSRLRRLVEAYEDPNQGYVSQARPMFERRFPGDYDHLARVSEWRFAARPPA